MTRLLHSGRSREGARGAHPPLFLDQTEARRAKRIWGEDRPPPPPPKKKTEMW